MNEPHRISRVFEGSGGRLAYLRRDRSTSVTLAIAAGLVPSYTPVVQDGYTVTLPGEDAMLRIGKTVIGAVVTAIGFVAQPEILNLLSPKVAGVVTAIGGVLTAIGLRHAIAKHGQ